MGLLWKPMPRVAVVMKPGVVVALNLVIPAINLVIRVVAAVVRSVLEVVLVPMGVAVRTLATMLVVPGVDVPLVMSARDMVNAVPAQVNVIDNCE